jgi:hypothetical protein
MHSGGEGRRVEGGRREASAGGTQARARAVAGAAPETMPRSPEGCSCMSLETARSQRADRSCVSYGCKMGLIWMSFRRCRGKPKGWAPHGVVPHTVALHTLHACKPTQYACRRLCCSRMHAHACRMADHNLRHACACMPFECMHAARAHVQQQ